MAGGIRAYSHLVGVVQTGNRVLIQIQCATRYSCEIFQYNSRSYIQYIPHARCIRQTSISYNTINQYNKSIYPLCALHLKWYPLALTFRVGAAGGKKSGGKKGKASGGSQASGGEVYEFVVWKPPLLGLSLTYWCWLAICSVFKSIFLSALYLLARACFG